MADGAADDYSIIEKTYVVEFEGKRFCIGAGDLVARLTGVNISHKGIEKVFRESGFSVTEIYDGARRILKPDDFGKNSRHYYYNIAVLAKRGAFRGFEQSQLPEKVKD